MKKQFFSFSSFLFLPFFALTKPQITFVIVLGILLLLVVIYGIFLFVKYKQDNKVLVPDDEPKIVQPVVEDVIVDEDVEMVVEEQSDIKEEVLEEVSPVKQVVVDKSEEVIVPKLAETELKEVIRYNYSLKAHIKLAPQESIERYLKIKNHIMSYPDVKISESWKFESFKYGARTLAKITLQGKTLRIYFDLDPAQFENTVYNVKDEGGKVNHKTTPTMFVVRGNRGVKHANELIDIYFKALNIKRGDDLEYVVPNYTETFEELVEQGLIKVPKSK